MPKEEVSEDMLQDQNKDTEALPIDMFQDSQDPWEDFDNSSHDNHIINWEGVGLYWDMPHSKAYWEYHNSY